MAGHLGLSQNSFIANATKASTTLAVSSTNDVDRLSTIVETQTKQSLLTAPTSAATMSATKVKVGNEVTKIDDYEVSMNWQGRYKPLGTSSTALMTLNVFNNLKKQASDQHMSNMLSQVSNTPASGSKDVLHVTTSQQDQFAMLSIFGEEITPQHISVFNILKRAAVKWKARAAQRKNIIPVEQFATSDTHKKAILKHKEQAMITLPMPLVWSVKEEVLAVLQDVVKVYRKEFGNNHKLTVDAKRRIDRLQVDLKKP